MTLFISAESEDIDRREETLGLSSDSVILPRLSDCLDVVMKHERSDSGHSNVKHLQYLNTFNALVDGRCWFYLRAWH